MLSYSLDAKQRAREEKIRLWRFEITARQGVNPAKAGSRFELSGCMPDIVFEEFLKLYRSWVRRKLV